MPNLNLKIPRENISRLMEEQRISQNQLAETLGYTQPNICKYLKSSTTIPLDFLYDVADHFGVTMDYLCQDHSNQPKVEPVTTLEEVPYVSPLIAVCNGLADIFKHAAISIKEIECQEVVYVEAIDDDGIDTGFYYRKRGVLGIDTDPFNKYQAIYFSNYDPVDGKGLTREEYEDYMSDIEHGGNTNTINCTINAFLRQLVDLYTIYQNGSIKKESYIDAIDRNLNDILNN